MKKLIFIEHGAADLLDAQAVDVVSKALERRYESHLYKSNASMGRLPERVRARVHGLPSGGALAGERFSVEAGFVPGQVQLRITLCDSDLSWGYPIETVIVAPDSELFSEKETASASNALRALFDFQDAYWSEYFASGRETFVTLDWSAHDYEGYTVYVRGSERAYSLEQEADKLFAAFGSGDHEISSVSAET
jgi:hypothetical protein